MNYTRVEKEKRNNTSYQGIIKSTYTELVKFFGQPEEPSIYYGKVRAEWVIEIAGCVIATIYDYKEDTPLRNLLQWHVGGKTKDVHQLVEIILKEQRKILNAK